MAVEWKGDANEFVAALVESGWLDRSSTRRLLVHDWPHHAERFVRSKLNSLGLAFCDEYESKTLSGDTSGDTSGDVSADDTPLFSALPADASRDPPRDLTEPNLTEPNRTKPVSCSKPSLEPPVALTEFDFPVVGDPEAVTWTCPQTLFDLMAESYPNLDTTAVMRAARAWCIANCQNRKTAGGMPKFLNGWFSKEQNGKVRNGPAPAQRSAATEQTRRARRYQGQGDG